MRKYFSAILGIICLILGTCASGDIDLDVTESSLGDLNVDGTTAPLTVTIKEKSGLCNARNVKLTFPSTIIDFGDIEAGKSKTLTQNIPPDEMQNGTLAGNKGQCQPAGLF